MSPKLNERRVLLSVDLSPNHALPVEEMPSWDMPTALNLARKGWLRIVEANPRQPLRFVVTTAGAFALGIFGGCS